MNFDSNMSICLARDSSRFDKVCLRLLLLHIIVVLPIFRSLMLTWLHVVGWTSIELFLTSSHRLVVKFSALLLKLIVTNIKSVPSNTMIAIFHLVSASTKLSWSVGTFLRIKEIVICSSSVVRMASSAKYLSRYMSLFSLIVRAISIPVTVSCVVGINIVRILMMSLNGWSLPCSSYVL